MAPERRAISDDERANANDEEASAREQSTLSRGYREQLRALTGEEKSP